MTITTTSTFVFDDLTPTRSRNVAGTTVTGQRRSARLQFMITGYWSAFWTLNGLDKFFDKPTFFGVTRTESFEDYFGRLGLSGEIVPAVLYGIGIYEIILGGMFAWALTTRGRHGAWVFLCLEASLVVFVAFSCGDILFGDRRELWEHACYIGLILLSHFLAQSQFENRKAR